MKQGNTLSQRLRRLATRSRPPEPMPIRLIQRRVYVLPTPAGLALLLTLLSMLLASINYNLSLGYALVFLLGSVFLSHILISWRTLVGLEVQIRTEGESFAGGRSTWQLCLGNKQQQVRAAIRLLAPDGQILLQTDAPARSTSTHTFELPALQRGQHLIGQLRIESRQPLGWIQAWAWLEPDAKALTYPGPAGSTNLPFDEVQAQEGDGELRSGQDDFAGLRNFQAGDSPRHIAWKQLAQGRGMLSKEFAGSAQTECVLNWSALPSGLSAEERLSQLCQWVLSARQQDCRSTLILPDSQTGPDSGPAHHQACLQRLALFGLPPQP